MTETRRRTITKSLIWRFIGIFWTWGGAYVILLLLPEEQKTAVVIATLVTAWHHSTRMIMYYIYERIWCRIHWGKEKDHSETTRITISAKQRFAWTGGTLLSLGLIFWLLLGITPSIKKDQKLMIQNRIEQGSVITPTKDIKTDTNNL